MTSELEEHYENYKAFENVENAVRDAKRYRNVLIDVRNHLVAAPPVDLEYLRKIVTEALDAT